jgi:hypothetical protein
MPRQQSPRATRSTGGVGYPQGRHRIRSPAKAPPAPITLEMSALGELNMQVEISGKTYTIVEAPIGAVIDHMGLMSDEPAKFQRILAQASVLGDDGKPMGDALMTVGVRVYMDLLMHVMKVNGFAGESGNE